ncbi:MAG TPA: ABC transporter substrate-binding protein [Myxococcales bacterium]|nr:ABC transporter substrate-binding protein [Myxococcales bacterium]
MTLSRRDLLGLAVASGGAALFSRRASAASKAKLRIGLLLPYSGTYAALGHNITDAMKLAAQEHGGKLGGREVEWVAVDDESDPAKAPSNVNKLIVGEKVDILTGPVHSGVAMAMMQIVRQEKTLTIVTNAGAQAVTGSLCAPHVFRTSFSNWQTSYPCAEAMLKAGRKKAALMFWNYSFGQESMAAFKEGYLKGGGTIVKEIPVPFPSTEFQANLSDIAALKPDAVFVFFAGAGAAKFVKDYADAGLKDKIALYGSGFLTEGVLAAQGAAAEGVRTTLHYADALDNAANKKFREAFKKATSRNADVYAVAGYDTVNVLAQALGKVQGDTGAGAQKELIAAIENVRIDSPRGSFRFSKAHNPIQDIYLREVKGGKEIVLGVAMKDAQDPAVGCNMTT